MISYTTTTHLPSAAEINYTDIEEICSYQLLMCKMFEQAGGFKVPFKTNCTIINVQKQGCFWMKNIKTIIEGILSPTNSTGLHLGAIPVLLDSYDIMHRICYRKPDFDYLGKIWVKVVDRWAKGDKSIPQTDLVLGILREIDKDVRLFEERYIHYALSVKCQWIDELTAFGKFQSLPLDESYRCLTYLLNADLFAFIGNEEQISAKYHWANAYTLSEKKLEALNTKTLYSYISFTQTTAQLFQLSLDEQNTECSHLFSLLVSRPDLPPLYRKAIEIGSENPKRLLA